MTYMTEPQNDGKNWCEPHRWAIMPALPLCYGRADADFDSPFACVVCDRCENDVDGNFSGPCECDRVFHSWIGVYEERIIERKEALLRVYARENHALRVRLLDYHIANSVLLHRIDVGAIGSDCLEANEAMIAENRRLQERIDALEWLREVEGATDFIRNWHRDAYSDDYKAYKRWIHIRLEHRASRRAARAAVEVEQPNRAPGNVPELCEECGGNIADDQCQCGEAK